MCQVMYSLSKKKVKNLAALNKAKECDQYPYFSRFFLQPQLISFSIFPESIGTFFWRLRIRSHKSLTPMKGVIFPDTHLGRT